MKKKIDWLNHSLEFMVVFIGILIAFQLNKCSENNTKQDLVNNHLEYILLECKENTAELNTYITHTREQIKYCDSILLQISTQKNIVAIRSYATRLLDMQNVELKKNSFEVLTQSGDIRFLTDYNEKRRIISMYDSFDKIRRVNQSNQNLYDNHFYPYLKTNFDLVNWSYVDAKSKSDKEKYYSKEFANIVSTYKYLLDSKLNIYTKEHQILHDYIR